ncbi:hypothetical protein UWK_00602 [Desulfocapsa sulfexigens DSM 10523]|uniref:Flagellar hook-length control protein FliK n=1 Tax=Desulfocapsa sulfexigens (strain DSM 10523 / SB164P1) TaxID=1167006 RepID=M1P0Y0_DESSD|nr:hypothetical protein [Desulfocapsa sulfexigens]AGF77183.1 hypothetical protein UWK_00602 [Desulfocapsa sulfexigens DSM 10523]
MITSTSQIAALYGPQGSSGLQSQKAQSGGAQMEPGRAGSATVIESRGQNMFLLETAGLRFEVQSNVPLVKGEQIQFQVLRTAPVLELQIVDPGLPSQARQALALAGDVINVKPLLQSLQKSFFSTSGSVLTGSAVSSDIARQDSQPVLQKMDAGAVEQLIRQGNYTVKATVTELLGENRAVVRIGGESYQLQGAIGAEVGESKVLQLQSLQPVPGFVVLNAGGVPGNTQPLLLTGQMQSLPALVRALQLPLFSGLELLQPTQQQLLHSMEGLQPIQLQEPGAGELLKTSLEQLGLRSEILANQGKGQDTVAQLKSVLAEISQIFKGQEEISTAAGRILATLESSQFIQASLQQENGVLFPLLFSFLEKGYLLVDQEAGGRNEEENKENDCSCTLHLTVEGLGNIRVRCVQTAEAVRIAFFLDTREKADFVATFGAELKETISSAPLLSLSFAAGAGAPGTTLLQKILPDDQSILDTSA